MSGIIKPNAGIVKQVSLEEFLGMIQREIQFSMARTAELGLRLGALQNALIAEGVIMDADVEAEFLKIKSEIEKNIPKAEAKTETLEEKPKSSPLLP